MSYVIGTLATLTALGAALTAMLYPLHRWAIRYQQAPATMDGRKPENMPGDIPPLIVAQPADIDEFTTDLELWLRLHTTLNGIEETLRIGLDDALARFLTVLQVDEADLLDRPGFIGVRELVGAP